VEKFPKKPVVIGAGPSGLCAAWNLATNETPVIVLEKTDKAGGLSSSFEDGGYLFDFGPHNIHTVHDDILNFLKKILKDDLLRHYPKTKIFFRNKLVKYPLKGINVFTVLPLTVMLLAAFNFLLARLKLFFFTPKNDNSFESWIKNRFGKTLYNIYFGPYAQKAWMVKASEISKYVAEKRVPPISISDYIRTLFNKPLKTTHSEDATKIENYYPKYGIGQLTDWFYNKILENNSNKVEFGVSDISIEGTGGKIESVSYVQDGKRKRVETDMVFSTIPINQLVASLKINVPSDIHDIASELDYVSEVLLFLKIKKERLFDSELVYFSSPDIKFNRVYDIGSFSKNCVPEGKTACCIEFTCNKNDDLWRTRDEELYKYAIDVFEKHNMLSENDIDGYLVKRITHAYPRFKVGFREKMQKILNYLSTTENIVTFGRQGLFCYANVDDALYMGFRVVEMLTTIRKKGIDYSELFPKYTNF